MKSSVASLRAQVEAKHPSAFAAYRRPGKEVIRTGIEQIDDMVRGVPLHSLTEICGSNLASSGRTSVLISLLAQATQAQFCALVDASDCFHPPSGHAGGINFSRMLWVRCGTYKTRLNRLEQAFKCADILLQSSGFGLIAVDFGNIPESMMRRVPLHSWFRFSRVIERHSAALVFIEQEPHAASCAGLVLKVRTTPPALSGKVFAGFSLQVEVVRGLEKKTARPESAGFVPHIQWA
jgi:hypothetical protein